ELAAELGSRGLAPRRSGRGLLVRIEDDATYDVVRDAVAGLGLPLNRLEQQRPRGEELFRDNDHPAEGGPRAHRPPGCPRPAGCPVAAGGARGAVGRGGARLGRRGGGGGTPPTAATAATTGRAWAGPRSSARCTGTACGPRSASAAARRRRSSRSSSSSPCACPRS